MQPSTGNATKANTSVFKHLILVCPTMAFGEVVQAALMAMCESIDGQRVFDPQQTGLHLVASDIQMNYAITANDLVSKYIQEQVTTGNLRHRDHPTSSLTMPTDEQTTKQFDDMVNDMYESYAKRMNHMSFGKANSEGCRTLVGPTLNTLCEGVSACPIILQDTWAQVTSIVGYNSEPTAGLCKKIPAPKAKASRGRNLSQQDMDVSSKQALLARAAKKDGVNMVLIQNDQGDSFTLQLQANEGISTKFEKFQPIWRHCLCFFYLFFPFAICIIVSCQ